MYYENRQLESTVPVDDGVRNGIMNVFYENGTLKYEGLWRNNKQEGLFKMYSENGNLIRENIFKNHKKISQKEYFEGGGLKSKGSYKNEIKHGEWTEYFENGKLSTKTEFESGNKINMQSWFENGNIISEEDQIKHKTKKSSQKTNSSTIKKHSNDLVDIGIYTHFNNKPFTGIMFLDDENGNVIEEIQMVDGLKHGPANQYYSNGQKRQELYYIEDEIDNNKKILFYDTDGHSMEMSEPLPLNIGEHDIKSVKDMVLNSLKDSKNKNNLLHATFDILSYLSKDKKTYNNLNDSIKYDEIKFFDNCSFDEIDSLQSVGNTDFYLQFKETLSGGHIQYSGDNNENSRWIEKYESFDNGDVDGDSFDKNKKVHESSNFERIFLFKINSQKFKNKIFKKIDEFKKSNDDFDFHDFCQSLSNDWYLNPDDSPRIFLESLLGEDCRDVVFYDVEIDIQSNLISWSVWDEIETTIFQLGILEKSETK